MALTYDAPVVYDASYLYSGTQVTPPTPQPVYAIEPTTPQKFTYLFTDLFGNTLAIFDKQMTGVSFSYTLNGAGTLSGTLSVEDPMMTQTNWVEATQVNKTCVWVDVNGTLVWGGIVSGNKYTMAAQNAAITANDFVSYLNQRLQSSTFATRWATPPGAGAMEMAYTIITDALSAVGSLPISVGKTGTTPQTYWITFSAPISQQQSLGTLVGQLQQLGWLVGFDYASDVSYVNGVPTAGIDLAYPRRGRIAGTTGLMVTTANATAFAYDVKGTSQSNAVVEMATAMGAVSSEFVWEPAISVDGYPLLEALGMHTLFTATTESTAVLDAWGANDLMLNTYPIVTPAVTHGAFDHPALGQWIVGDDVRLVVPKQTGLPANPRFPKGLDFYFRIIAATVTVSDEGLPTTQFTYNMPPSSTPQRPPL